MAAGSIIIRRLLVDDARRRNCLKRGGPLTGQSQTTGVFAEQTRSLDLIELNDALELLQTRYPRAAQVVEFRFFAGLTYEEISEQLAISVRTVKSDWQFAKCWLYRELEKHT
ncbi:ECF-type sigma factor [Stieleria bergensis]|uniref:ECF-type sigma factor n=1 Tax=Stieleria bergensis TaxID=2528025 RepID=UPI003AF3B107